MLKSFAITFLYQTFDLFPGPVVTLMNNRPTVVGIVSWGEGDCDNNHKPGDFITNKHINLVCQMISYKQSTILRSWTSFSGLKFHRIAFEYKIYSPKVPNIFPDLISDSIQWLGKFRECVSV